MIDDDVEDQEIFAETLFSIDQSIQCHSILDARQALSKLLSKGANLPDFIFLDLNMPIMDGFEFLKAIKKQKTLSHIPVIVYTTSSESHHKDKALHLGASSFITKPSELAQLKHVIKGTLSFDRY